MQVWILVLDNLQPAYNYSVSEIFYTEQDQIQNY